MAFTTPLFLFIFLPVCLSLYFLICGLQKKGKLSGLLQKLRATDIILIVFGSGFYAWACFDDLIRLYIYIYIVYLAGLLIQRTKHDQFALYKQASGKQHSLPASLPFFVLGILFTVFVLIQFKYTNLLAQAWNFFFKDTISGKSVLAPLGISFITFSAVSYLTDIYRGNAAAGSLIDCALYLTFFPKVVSGPIVLWKDFAGQINNHTVTLAGLTDGITRIMIGFAKKLILADTFGACIASASGAVDTQTVFGVALLYMLQIYYDFSGYSDIAIGLSNMFGFSVKENFNFPYLSCSITEFWQRWHISLGTWFREYIYIPLGGSRAGKTRTVINVAVVFLLTGIWHGAGWSYMLWGMINGLCNIIEKLLKNVRIYKKIPRIFKWCATMTVTYFCWELFRFGSFSASKDWFMALLGITRCSDIPYTWQYYFDAQMISLVIVAVLGATVWGLPAVQNTYQRFVRSKWGYAIHEIVVIVLFIISILFMISSDYSPFIYFQY